jgi:hypothetical protein
MKGSKMYDNDEESFVKTSRIKNRKVVSKDEKAESKPAKHFFKKSDRLNAKHMLKNYEQVVYKD